jgi:hypothetical protein
MAFVEAHLGELLLNGLRDLAAGVVPTAAAAGIALTIATTISLWARRALRRSRRPHRTLPAAA